MNILYLHTHDAGRYIEPQGYKIPTPHLTRLAGEATLFRQAHTANPTCSPSRAALLTGTYPHENGMFGLAHNTAGGFSLNNYDEHLGAFLKREGNYETALSGIQHVDGPLTPWDEEGVKQKEQGSRLPYDFMLNSKDMTGPFASEMAAERAVEYIKEDREKPFFLAVGFMEPHADFEELSDDIPADFCPVPDALPDCDAIRKDMAGYSKMMRETDERMGMVIEALKEKGIYDETLIICTTDHGIGFPSMKCTLRDHGTGVFLIVKAPGQKEGLVSDAMVSHLDIFPTVCDYTGFASPERLRGKSLRPLIEKKTDKVHDEIFTEINYHAAYDPQRAVRTERYKYIRRFHTYQTRTMANTDYSRSKIFMSKQGFFQEPVGKEELYDLMLDPNESRNLTDIDDYKDVLNQLRETLKNWMIWTDDPLLNGPIPLPEGHLIYPQDLEIMKLDIEELVDSSQWNPQLTWIGWED